MYTCLYMSKEEIVSCVKSVRKEKGITQQDLAEAVGVTRQTIIAIEKGNYTPSILLALKLAKYIGQPVEDIFGIARKRK